jgi:K+-transporting ATPase A subunit
MLVFVVLAVFIAGLMVGRTPEYLGKKIQAFDVKMAMLSLLVLCAPSSASPPGPRGAIGARPA